MREVGPTGETDADLVRRSLAGREEAFRQLFLRYREHIYQVTRRLVGNKEDALDLTQETFVKAFSTLSRFRGEASFKTYLTRIAVNACLDFRRRRAAGGGASPTPLELDEERARSADHSVTLRSDPVLQAQKHELQEALRKALDKLPENLRTTLLLHAVEGYTYREVAEVLRVPIGTVMSRIHYARNHIRRTLRGFLEA